MELELAGFDGCEQWGRDSWEHELSHPALAVLVAGDDQLHGVIALRIGPDVCDLDRIIVTPGSRRRGIGRRLMTAGLELAAGRGVQEMILEVRTDNESAIALYRSYGFEQFSVRKDYYGPGSDAMIMRRPLGDDDHD
ncbi:ribosomal-protein-alanine N-acetyltransferase [Microlunatus sp. Gsoil 973]|nr:ribosomal-protein-alanine N-acetyltransferase [Microlunatus sp. Gsoil 973]